VVDYDMFIHQTKNYLVSLLLIIVIANVLSVPELNGYLSFAWRVEPSLDRNEYLPGSEGIIDENVVNVGQTILNIYQTVVMFDWQKPTGKWWYLDVDIEVELAERTHLGKFSFEIPDDVAPGKHTFEVGLRHRHLGLREGWQDDGLQWSTLTYEIFITEPKEAELRILNMSQTPLQGEAFYVGDMGSLSYQLKNIGGGIAKQVKLELETPPGEEIISLVTSTSPKDLEPRSIGEWTIQIRGEKPGNISAKIQLFISENKIDEADFQVIVSEPYLEMVSKNNTPGEGEPVYPGDILIVKYMMRNKGSSTVESLTVLPEVPEGMTLIETGKPVRIEPEETAPLSFKIRADTPGEQYFQILFFNSEKELPSYRAQGTVTVSENPVWTQIFNQANYELLSIILIITVMATSIIILSRRRRPADVIVSKELQFCSKCGTKISNHDSFCQNCGNKIN
jgi:hypothetical protein